MDETCDISTHEQVAVIIRYADENLKIQERFLEFKITGSTTGEDLSKLLVTYLKDLG